MPSPSDPDAHYALEIIKANARLLYGRHQTYDIAISQPKFPGQSLGTPRYHGQKIHALLIGYTTGCTPAGKEVSGKLLRGTYSMGLHKNAPKVGDAIQILHEEVAADVEGLLAGLIEQPEFEGALVRRRNVGRAPEMVEGKGKGKEREGDGDGDVDVDDGIDGVTLRGD